jgi:Zn-dependent M28 family amino/carboxypeptidase
LKGDFYRAIRPELKNYKQVRTLNAPDTSLLITLPQPMQLVMNNLRTSLILLFVFASQLALAQKSKTPKLSKSEKAIVASLQTHISYLADDKLEGRRAGTNGEKLAMEYISNEFRKTGLHPKGTNGFYQPFEIYDGKKINSATHFVINGNDLKAEKDFFPLPFSSNASIEALPAIAVQEADMPWFFDLKDGLEENKTNPHFDLPEYIRSNAIKAKAKGAAAVIFYNTSSADDQLKFENKDRLEKLDIPVVYVSKETARKYFADESATVDIKLRTDIGEKKRTGHNVIGYIDNGAATTVVLGAHYDHLGYGEDGNSMLRTGEKMVHNGADDNASGTAALIELAKMLKNSKAKNNNYLFIAFSAEELGLNGSKHFVENPTIDLKGISYMINMDMVGRLNDSTKVLTVGGYGTSPQWSSLVNTNEIKSPFVIKVDSSGTGPSDHTSFYRKDIPVLFFFTGLHTEYHRPTDDAEKINYAGELRIIQYISSVITNAGKQGNKLVFTKTRETQTTTSARFSVTMGIMPDYTFSGTGVRCDGVTDGRPAQKAGLQAGDIIVQIGDYAVSSVESYMQTLGRFKKGDKAKLKYRRGNDLREAEVQF